VPRTIPMTSANLLFDDRPPRHEAEAEPIINHDETPAGELSGANEPATYGLSVLDRAEGMAPFRGKLPSTQPRMFGGVAAVPAFRKGAL
jgi:hypothetical protein